MTSACMTLDLLLERLRLMLAENDRLRQRGQQPRYGEAEVAGLRRAINIVGDIP